MSRVILGLILIAEISVGGASQYAPGVMQRTISLRQRWNQLPQEITGYAGYIAVQECDDIGKTYEVRPVGTLRWDRVLAVDCASKSDSRTSDGLSGWQWMVKNNILVEVDYALAKRWKTVGHLIQIEMREPSGNYASNERAISEIRGLVP